MFVSQLVEEFRGHEEMRGILIITSLYHCVCRVREIEGISFCCILLVMWPDVMGHNMLKMFTVKRSV